MRLTTVNFSNKDFSLQQKWNSRSAKYLGKADRVISYSVEDIADYLEQYPAFKKYEKGFGNYFWKPFIIKKALKEVAYNDFLFYCDSGVFILKNIKVLAKYLNSVEKDILLFKLPLIQKQWTKKDTFLLLNADTPYFLDATQIAATSILIKKTPASIEFFEKFRIHCLDERIVTDMNNTLGQNNDDQFIAHRHDQSILSILALNSDIVQIEGDLSDYGFFPRQYLRGKNWLRNDFYKNLNNYKFRNYILSNRKTNPLIYFLKFSIKRFLFSINLYKRC